VALHVRDATSTPNIGLPTTYALSAARPNPFGPSTAIGFALPQPGRVQLKIYDVTGRLVRRLVDRALPAGYHTAQWRGVDNQGRRVASGTYYYLLDCGDYTKTRKVTLLK